MLGVEVWKFGYSLEGPNTGDGIRLCAVDTNSWGPTELTVHLCWLCCVSWCVFWIEVIKGYHSEQIILFLPLLFSP